MQIKKIFINSLIISLMLVRVASTLNAQEAVPDDYEKTTVVKAGDVAPDFTVKMLDGSSFKLSDAKGKVVLLNFWATWCGPCMLEFNRIPEKLLKRFEGEKDFVFIPVSREETFETVQRKMKELKEKGIDFPVGLDPKRAIYNIYATTYIPRNFLIGKDGKVVSATIGFTEKEFEVMIEKIAELLK